MIYKMIKYNNSGMVIPGFMRCNTKILNTERDVIINFTTRFIHQRN